MSTSVSSPTPPQQPSTADAVREWVNSMPQVYQTQMEYAPLQAQQQVQLAEQFAQPLGEAYLAAQKAMYPETTAIQEAYAQQALQGSTQGLSDAERRDYMDYFNANLGSNAGSGIGANYVANNLTQLDLQRKDYYRNLGLSLAGRSPLAQPSAPQTSDYMSSFTPNSVMGYTSNNYGTYSNAYANMYGANAGVTSSMNQMYGQMVGGVAGGLGTWMAG